MTGTGLGLKSSPVSGTIDSMVGLNKSVPFDREPVTIDEIMASLDKDTLSKIQIASDISKDVLPTASFGLNRIMGGGLRIGKQHTVWGGEQGGKSAVMMQTVAVNQALGEPCAWIDAEHSFDPAWATRLGVDTDKLITTQASTIAEIADLQVKLIRSGVRLLVIDSTSALMPKSFIDKDGEIKDFADTGQLGQMAKDLGQMCKMVQGINYNCAVVHISQARVDVGNAAMQKPFKPVGGKEVEHTDSFRVRLFSSKAEKEALMGEVQYGDIVMQEQIGRKVIWKIDKNKINGKYGTGKYNLYTSGEYVGVDRNIELVNYGVDFGIIQKGGSWFTIYGEKMQGDENASKYLRDNPDIAEKVEAEINAKSL